MMELRRAALVVVAVIGTLAALLFVPGVVRAQTQPSNALVTITDKPDPATSGGNVVYTITGKDDGPMRSCPLPPLDCSDKPTLEAEIPAGATFVSCKASDWDVPPKEVLCTVSGAIVTAQFPTVPAHATVKMTLTVKAPLVTALTTISLRGKFSGESMHMDERLQSTTILPPATRLLMSPSGRTVMIDCGYTLDSATFGADIAGTLLDGVVCGNGSGLTFSASGRTLNLGGKKIVSSVRVTGNAGIIVGPNATNVTINGGGTEGTKGIEQFEYCLKDLGGNTGMHVTGLRCYRAKAVGILTSSNEVLIDNSLIDNTIPDAKVEAPGGGIGIQAGGDNIRVKDTIVRRSAKIGFWAYGVDADGSGRVATYDGNTTTSRIESNFGIGVLLSGGPHEIKGTQVQGDDSQTGTSMEGIVVAGDAQGTIIEEVVVKKHHGHGIRVDVGATGTVIERTTVEDIGGSGYVIDAPSTLNGNSAAMVLGDAFVINTPAVLTSNSVEACSGNAFVINSAVVVDSNSAADNDGYGFVVTNAAPGVDTGWSVQGVGDFDRNGTADILWRHTSGDGAMWLMNSAGTGVLSPSAFSVGTDWSIVGVGDFNGDGKADILWHHTSGCVYLWLQNGASRIGEGSLGCTSTDWSIVGVGDFNGDGKADVLWRHTSGAVYLWLQNGTTRIGEGSLGGATTDWSIAGVGDFNGDGKADILWHHTSGCVYVWLLNGATRIGEGSLGCTSTDWSIVGVGDFNGDGKADVLWHHTSGAVYLWLLNGTSRIGEGSLAGVPTSWSIAGVADFNHDGKADVLWHNVSGCVYVWLLSGTSRIGEGSLGCVTTETSGGARLRSNTAEGNALGGFLLSGSGNVLEGNSAKTNGGRGFAITGSGNVLNTNAAERSVGFEFEIGLNNIDDSNNKANGTGFSFPAAGGKFE